MSSQELLCGSELVRVLVYARGATLTRRLRWTGELPSGPLQLKITGLSAQLLPASLRATSHQGRAIQHSASRLVYPQAPAPTPEARARVEALERQLKHLERQRQSALRRREALRQIKLNTRPTQSPRLRRDPAAAFSAAAASAALLDQLQAQAHASIVQGEQQHKALQVDLEAARLALTLDSASHTAHEASREVTLELAESGREPEYIEISYDIEAARWWPAYTARLEQGGAQGQLWMDAFVAQGSGEDWGDVELTLCTADRSREVNLPSLGSLRLGRQQRPASRGYRPPPSDLDELFEDWRQALPGRPAAKPVPRKPLPPVGPPPPAPPPAAMPLSAVPRPEGGARPPAQALESSSALPGLGGIPVYPAQSKSGGLMRKRAAAPLRDAEGDMEMSDDDYGGAPPEPALVPQVAALEPGEAWRDFRDLTLPDPEGAASAGRLQRRSPPRGPAAGSDALERLESPAWCADPLRERGLFDHRYRAQGVVEVPATAQPVRISLRSAQVQPHLVLRCLPREDEHVYRELELTNPFGAPLLAGPIDIFMEGAMLRTSRLPAMDTGARARFGLGVEERVRVARNSRVEESSQGLFVNTTVIDHHIELELASSLPTVAHVEILERVPVTDEKDLEVALTAHEPRATRYEQEDVGHPVRGGLKWSLELPPGGQRQIKFSYSLKLPARSEIQGGNRRE